MNMTPKEHDPASRPRGVRVLALAGSLRRDSFNRRLLETAATLAPRGMTLAVHDTIADIPLFNEDVEATGQGQEGVRRLRDAVAQADGLLIATPEYNQSLPGVLKNAIDWLSRADGAGREVLDGKPVAIVGATTGAWGTRLAQSQLRHALSATGARTLPSPMLFVREAALAYDVANGRYDDATQDKLQSTLDAFLDWIRTVAPRTGPAH